MTPEGFRLAVSPGIELDCRACGPEDAPLVVLLHGFPEAAFVWDELMQRLAARWRCVAPDLRGYGGSSAPPEVEAYRIERLVDDVVGLIEAQAGRPGRPGRAFAVVGHDWGGAVAWALAARHPGRLQRLVILNAPHPALFLRGLQADPAQQAASAYMNFLLRPDAEALLAENDFARLFRLFTGMGAADRDHPGGGWLDEPQRARYRAVWRQGLQGAVNYYRASPLRPPTAADPSRLHREGLAGPTRIEAATLVLWGLADTALAPALLEGLDEHVADLRIERLPHATHWLLHEQPAHLAASIERFLSDA